MLRTLTTRNTTPLIRLTLTTMRHTSSEGATGSGYSRPGGVASGDSFTKREKAAEDRYMRERDTQKLKELKEKLLQQRKHLDELDKHIEEMTKEQGGEKN